MRRRKKHCNSRSVFRLMFVRRGRHVLGVLVVFCTLTLSTQSLAALTAENDTDRRLGEANAHFAREKAADTWWYYGWLGFSSAILATSTTLYATMEHEPRIHRAQPISMVVSGLGVTTMIMFKPKSFAAQAELTAMPENTAEEKAAKLQKKSGVASDQRRTAAIYHRIHRAAGYSHTAVNSLDHRCNLV